MFADLPLTEYDPTVPALIEPANLLSPRDMPAACVLAILPEAVAHLAATGRTQVIFECDTGLGPWPVYELDLDGQRVALHNPGVGGPLSAARLEELIALGCRRFILTGGCGVLDRDIVGGHLIIPDRAVRDEGTSFHYLPPSREVTADPAVVAAVERSLRQQGFDPLVAKTWTTDAVYRETPERIRRRRAEGCLTVEMEAASLLAVAQFRQVPLGVILYAGDDVSGAEWDVRDFTRAPIRERLIGVAARAALAL